VERNPIQGVGGTTVDSELLRRKSVVGKGTCPESSADSSARGWLLLVEGETLVLFFGVVVVQRLRWRQSTVNRWHSKKQSRGEGGGNESGNGSRPCV
jgi:hypothetical protein